MKKKIVYFNRIKYRLMGSGKYYLAAHTTNAARRKAKGLHVAIWEFHNECEVPKSHVIHHIDGDSLNNNIKNLLCVSHKEHMALHREDRIRRGRLPEQLKHLEKIREKTKAWHRSEVGRQWHKEHAKTSLAKARKPIHQHKCVICQKKYKTSRIFSSACSNKCHAALRRLQKKDNIQKTCIICQKTFSHNKYQKRLTCSRSCKAKLI